MPALFPRLVEASDEVWHAYTRHQFVLLLAAGDLPEACFRRYLVQDYLFLLHFARAWGLAVYNSDTLPEMRRALRLVAATRGKRGVSKTTREVTARVRVSRLKRYRDTKPLR